MGYDDKGVRRYTSSYLEELKWGTTTKGTTTQEKKIKNTQKKQENGGKQKTEPGKN